MLHEFWHSVRTDTSARLALARAEFWTDAVIHALGLGLAVVGAAVLLWQTAAAPEGIVLGAAAIYCTALLAMLSFSAAYHLLPLPAWRDQLRRYDQAAIFLKIAGTYTPFALVNMSGVWGVSLLLIVWAVATFGVAMKLFWPNVQEWISLALYVGLGWTGLAFAWPMAAALPMPALVLLGVGGVIYTAGVAFYVLEKLPFQKAIWHAFVLAGTCLHWAAVREAIAP